MESLSGLPDGLLFPKQESQFGYILEGLGKEMFLYLKIIWNILCTFGEIYGEFV
jgi:hypothetical protein